MLPLATMEISLFYFFFGSICPCLHVPSLGVLGASGVLLCLS